MGVPQILMIVIIAMEMGVQLSKDGQPKTGEHSFWWAAFTWATILWILIAGGFFK